MAVELLLLAIFLRTSIFFGKVDSFSNIAASNGGNVAVMNASNEKKLKRRKRRFLLWTSISFGEVESFSNIASSNEGNVAVMNASNEKKLKRMRMRKKKKKTSQKSCSFLNITVMSASNGE